MSVRLKLTLWYSVVVAFTLIVFSLVIYTFLSYSMAQETDKELAGRAQGVVSSIKIVGPTLLRGQQIVLPDVDVFGYPNTYLQVVDNNGRLVAKSGNLGSQSLPLSEETIVRGAAGNSFYEWVKAGDQRIRIYNYPLIAQDRVVGLLQVGQPFSGIEAALKRLRMLLWLGSVIIIAAAASIGWLLARAALKPINEITKTANLIRKELNFHQRVPHQGPKDELGQLVETLNKMLESIETAYRELSESHAAQRRFVADVSHELRTPLTTIRGNIELIQKMGDEYPDIRKEALLDILSEAERMSRLVSDMLVLARADAGLTLKLQTVPLQPIIEQIGRQAKMLAGNHVFNIKQQPTCRDVFINADPDYFKQLILILLDNAFKFTPPSGKVELHVHCTDEYVQVDVSDTGIGIDEKELSAIFERFYRSDDSRPVGGTGLGLSIAGWIAKQHGTTIEVNSKLNAGSTFSVRISKFFNLPA